jgi:hypothetical protein
MEIKLIILKGYSNLMNTYAVPAGLAERGGGQEQWPLQFLESYKKQNLLSNNDFLLLQPKNIS